VTAHQGSGALFVESQEDLGKRFRLRLGGRFDYHNTSSTPDGGDTSSHGKSIFSPKLGLLYHLPVLFDLYANASRGFRETDGVIDDPTLPFITEWAYEAGVKRDVGRFNGSVAVFRMDVSNEQTFNPITLADVNGGSSRRDGVEAQGSADLTPSLRLSTDWTFTNARYRQLITEDGDTLNGARVFNTARYTGIASLEVAPPGMPWRLRVGTNVVGPYSPFDEPGVVRPAYGLLQVSAGYRMGMADLQVGVRNALDRTYRELEAGGFVTPGVPREVSATLRYHF
jgi:iron complex outermembrane recepter protein